MILYIVHDGYGGDSESPMESIRGIYTSFDAAHARAAEFDRLYEGYCQVTEVESDEPIDPPGDH